MRLALVTPVFPAELDQPSRGAGIGAVTLIRAMKELEPDLDVHVVHYRAPRSEAPRLLGPGLTVHRVRGSRLARAAPSPLPMQAEVARVLRSLSPEVVHVRGTASFVDGRRWPAVLSVHGITEREVALSGLPAARLRALVHQVREPAARRRYAHVIAIVGYVARELEDQLTGRVHFVPNPIPDDFFDAAPRRGATAPLVVQAADVCPIKNQLATVRAAAILARRGVAFRLRLLGKVTYPDYGRRVEALVRELGLADRVDLPGRIGRAEMPEELLRARVLVSPSLVEVAPLAIAEASAVGAPAVASPAGGSAEMVIHQHTGFVVSASSPESIANGLQPLLEDEDLARLMGSRARALAERHRAAAVARATLDVYRQMKAG